MTAMVEWVLCIVSVLVVIGTAWWLLKDATLGQSLSKALTAWAASRSQETERALLTAYAEGHQDGQEYERLRGK